MTEALVQINTISKIFSDGKKTTGLKDVSLSVTDGEVLCLVGPSGAGKSTLLRCLAGLEEIDGGTISYRAGAAGIFVAQDFNLWPHKTVLENIILAPVQLGTLTRGAAIEEADVLLKKFDLYDKRHSYPDFLSGGQKQRVAIIRALINKPKLLLLDEITSALDPELVNSVLGVIKILAKEGQAMVLATHHLKFATEVADRIIFLDAGKMVQDSTPRDFMYSQTNPRINEFIKTLSVNKQEINVYEGYEQFQAFQLGTLKRFKKGSSKNVVGSSGDRWFECMGSYYEQYEKERIERGISWRMIMRSESPLDRDARIQHPELNEYRILPKHIENPANYYVIDDVVVIQIFGNAEDAPAIIEIKNAHVAKSYQSYFNALWEQSEIVE